MAINSERECVSAQSFILSIPCIFCKKYIPALVFEGEILQPSYLQPPLNNVTAFFGQTSSPKIV
jgi:hypothetical protein